jgi:hypothetical protein
MRRIVSTGIAVIFMTISTFAQIDTTTKAPKAQINLKKAESRSSDHFIIQFGYLNWTAAPDSIRKTGFPHSFNVYLMLDFPFKTNTHWSVALGPGIGSDHMYFDKMYAGVKDNTPSIVFQDHEDTTHFKKVKLATNYAELPIELRYRFNTASDKSSVKIAFGVKVGALINAHVRASELQNSADETLNAYVLKESSKRFFNKSRLSVMGRVGLGHYSLFASYGVTPIFKEGQGPIVRPLTVGIMLSGL